MNQRKSLKPTPVDEGWAWVILASGILVFSIAGGMIKNFGLLFADILHTFGKSATSTAFIPSTHFFALQLAGFPANYLCGKYSIKKIVIGGGFVYALGYFTTAWVPTMEFMYLTAAIAGAGAGFCMSTTITIVTHSFDKYRAKAVGLVTCSSGILTFGLPHIYQWWQEKYGLRGEIMLISGLLLQICVGASFWRQPIRKLNENDQEEIHVADEKHSAVEFSAEFNSSTDLSKAGNSISLEVIAVSDKAINANGPVQQNGKPVVASAENANSEELEKEPMIENGDIDNSDDKPKRSVQKITFDPMIIKKPDFIISAVSFFLGAFAFVMVSVILPVYTEERTNSVDNKAIMMMCVGGTEAVGKFFVGALVDLKILTARTVWSINLTICAVAVFCLIYAESIISICILASIWAAMGGTLFMLHTLTYVETLGLDKLTSCLGMANLFGASANLFSSPLAGVIKDSTGKWDGAFILAAGVFLTGAMTMQSRWICRLFRKCSR